MPCGCTENKNLDKDKLSLESMQTLSIDEIINLYRQGYTLEESENFTDIRSLATKAYPNIEGATARYNGSSTIPMLLYGNSGSYGYVHLEAYLAPSTVISEIKECANVMTDLYKLAVFPAVSGVVNDIMFRAKACDTFATETCTTCTNEAQTGNWTTGAYPGANITTPPPTPTGLTITSGDSYLVLSWNSVADPTGSGEVFAYKVTVTGPGGITGYRPSGSSGRTVTISGLTNGTSYSISVKSLSHNNVESTGAATGTGIPSLPTPTLNTITITPATASINVGATQQLTPVCKDQNTNIMTCPTLTWLSSDTTKATVISSGLVTGVAIGSTNITAGASGVTSNASAITVNPLTCTAITNVSATPNPVTQGQTTTLTTTTTPAIAGFSVVFKDGATILQTVTTNSSGVATYPWPTAGQSTGAHSITASVGTPAQCTSISATTVTISPPSCASITLFASPTSVTVGETVTLTATTNPAIAGFNVAFKDGATILQTVATNSSGVATYQWNTAGQGTGAHPLTASVAGQCTSSMTTVTISTVQQNCTAITNVSASPNPVTQGQTTTLTATTTPAIAGFNVVFKDGTTTLQTVTTNSSGVATYPWPTAGQSTGAHSITASVGTPAQCTSLSATTVTITTVAQVLTSISPASATIQINTTQQFTAKDQNGNTIATGVAWARTAGVGSINTTGLYSAGPTDGTATISATYGGVTKTAPVTVTTTPPPQAGGGGAIMIAAVAAIAIAYFMMRKPPTPPT